MVNDITCSHCGVVGLEPGFVEDAGRGASGYTRWIAGILERGVLGGAKRAGRQHRQIDAYRCPGCSHLELFATRVIGPR